MSLYQGTSLDVPQHSYYLVIPGRPEPRLRGKDDEESVVGAMPRLRSAHPRL